MVVVGAHFLLRCLDLEQFVLYVVKVVRAYHVSLVEFFCLLLVYAVRFYPLYHMMLLITLSGI